MRAAWFYACSAAASVVLEDATAQLQMRKVHLDDDESLHRDAEDAISKVAEEAKEAISKLADHAHHAASKVTPPQWKSSSSLLSHITEVSNAGVHIPKPDFSGAVEMVKEAVDSYPQQFHASIPITENGITFTTMAIPGLGDVEFAVFPMNHHYGGVSARRSTPSTGRDEIGELRWIADIAGEISAMPGTKIGFAERFFIKEHTGTWEATENHTYNATQDSTAAAQATVRTGMVAAFDAVSRFSKTIMPAAVDLAWGKFFKQYLATNVFTDHATKTQILSDTETLHSDVDELIVDPISIATSCIHMLDHDLIIPLPGGQAAMMPLGINLPVGRAQTTFHPTYSISAAYGVGSFHMSDDGSRLIFHVGSSSYAEFQFTRSGFGTSAASMDYAVPPRLLLSDYDGVGYPAAPVQFTDFRVGHPASDAVLTEFQTKKNNQTWMHAMNTLFTNYAQIPMSYGLLYQNMDDVCDSETLELRQAEASQLDFWAMMVGGMNAAEYDTFMGHALHTLPCGLSFLRGAQDYSNGMDTLETLVWTHFLMEWPNTHRMNAVRGSTTAQEGWHWKAMPATTATSAASAAATAA